MRAEYLLIKEQDDDLYKITKYSSLEDALYAQIKYDGRSYIAKIVKPRVIE